MCAHSKEVIDKFCTLCDRLIQVWQMRKYLFDENPDKVVFENPRNGLFFVHLQDVLQESWCIQLAKLHDPAVQGRNINLSLDYMIERGHWEPEAKKELIGLKSKMEESLAGPIRIARDKILAHNDEPTLLNSKDLGSFATGEDETYFLNLREFASLGKANGPWGWGAICHL